MAEQKQIRNARNEEVYHTLDHMLKDLKYGSITLVVQDGKIIQINKEEKLRI